MSNTRTKIEWTDKTWSPVTGCDKVSPGCKHCYAEGVADRFWATQYPQVRFFGKPGAGGEVVEYERPRKFTDVQCHEDRLLDPLSWRKPCRVFVNSMSDLFHEDVPDAFIDRVFAVMALAPQHTFQILTKRPERMRAYMSATKGSAGVICRVNAAGREIPKGSWWKGHHTSWPWSNVWLGVSVENQQYADERIPLLLETPSAVRFISAEPLLGPIDFTLRGHRITEWDEDWRYNVLSGEEWAGTRDENPARSQHLDWLIVGGESGYNARPCNVAWIRSIVEQCHAARVPIFVKQLGAKPFVAEASDWSIGAPDGTFGIKDRKGGDPSEWPAGDWPREFPA